MLAFVVEMPAVVTGTGKVGFVELASSSELPVIVGKRSEKITIIQESWFCLYPGYLNQ